MPEKTAKILEVGGNGGSLAAFFAALGVWLGTGFEWLNTNYMAIMALCAVVSCGVGVYGTITRVRIARQQKRRDTDNG